MVKYLIDIARYSLSLSVRAGYKREYTYKVSSGVHQCKIYIFVVEEDKSVF